jgi:hypothetical protein
VVDDARSALQLDRTRYDVIVSEPSNPWVAGIATLYTPEFFRIARSRLADDGIFCQWIQLYQLPLPIVAGIVRSLREVFPHVHVWFGGTSDLVVLASGRPISYDRQWVAQLLGPGGELHGLGREWLSIDSLDQYFGRMLLGDSGVTRLITRATFDHTDNRPRLEFVAARRFLDPGAAAHAVFDSLMQIGTRDDGTSPFALLRILALRRGDPGVLPYLEGARRAQPDVAEWSVRMAGIRLAMGDTARADSLLETVLAPGRHLRSDALVMRALLAAVRSRPLATVWLREALAARPDCRPEPALGRSRARGTRRVERRARNVPPPIPRRVSEPGVGADCHRRPARPRRQRAAVRREPPARIGALPRAGGRGGVTGRPLRRRGGRVCGAAGFRDAAGERPGLGAGLLGRSGL